MTGLQEVLKPELLSSQLAIPVDSMSAFSYYFFFSLLPQKFASHSLHNLDLTYHIIFSRFLGTFPRSPNMISITINFMFHICSSLARYSFSLSLIFSDLLDWQNPLFSVVCWIGKIHYFQWSAGLAKSTIFCGLLDWQNPLFSVVCWIGKIHYFLWSAGLAKSTIFCGLLDWQNPLFSVVCCIGKIHYFQWSVGLAKYTIFFLLIKTASSSGLD